MLNPVALREPLATTSAAPGNSGHCRHPDLAQSPESPMRVLGCEKASETEALQDVLLTGTTMAQGRG